MVTKQEILDALHDELAATLADELSIPVSDAYPHVRHAEQTGDAELPAYTLTAFAAPVDRGLGDDTDVHEVVKTADGVEVTTRREKEATVDIGAHAAGDDARQMNTLYKRAETALTEAYNGSPEALDVDVEEVTIEGTQDVSSPEDSVRGDRLRLTVRYYRLFGPQTYPSMDDIDVDVQVGIDNSDGADESRNDNVTFSYNS